MKRLLIITTLTLLTNFLFAQTVEKLSFTMQEAVEFAKENNSLVKNSLIDIEIADKKVWETTAIGLPQVNGSASYSNIFSVPEMSFGPYIDWYSMPAGTAITPELIGAYTREGNSIQLGVKENVTWDITVSQLIFSGEYLVGLQASRTYREMSDLGLEKSLLDVKQQVSDAYILVLLLKRNYQNIEKSLENTKKLLVEMEATNKVGFSDKQGVDQFRLTVANLGNALLSIQRQVNTAEMLLKLQMGYEIGKGISLSQTLDEIFENNDYANYVNQEFSIENNIEYKIFNTQEKLTLLSLKQQKSKSLPTLSGFYKHQEQFKSADFNFFNPNMIGVSLNVPIFSSFSRHSKIQQAKLELLKVQNTKIQVSDGLQVQISQAGNDLSTAWEKFTVEKENLCLAEKIYNDTVIKFKNGTSSGLELTQAQNQMLNTQSSYFTAMFEVLKAKNTLDKALNNL
ncbi:MAG: TolC family protein [Bacteroidales bacterium]|nr:TolC family protein [Bacteroidales bacterium]